MKNSIANVLPMITKIPEVTVVYKGLEYRATLTDVQQLQLMVVKGEIDRNDVKVIDKDGTTELSMLEDGCFDKDFTSNFYSLSSDILFERNSILLGF